MGKILYCSHDWTDFIFVKHILLHISGSWPIGVQFSRSWADTQIDTHTHTHTHKHIQRLLHALTHTRVIFPLGVMDYVMEQLWGGVGSRCSTSACRHGEGIHSLKASLVCCCSVFQSVAVRFSVLQCVAVCCSVFQCVATCCRVLQCDAVYCSVLQCGAVR